MKKVAIVLPFFDVVKSEFDIENQFKKYANVCELIQTFPEDCIIDIITTTSTMIRKNWKNDTEPEQSNFGKYRLKRFLVNYQYANAIKSKGKKWEGKEPSEMSGYFHNFEMGPVSPDLFAYVRTYYKKYNALFFWGEKYYTSAVCMQGMQNAMLVPCLDKETDDVLPRIRKLFENEVVEEEDKSESFGMLESNFKPAFEKNNVAVVLASDNNYVPLLNVAIQSIIDYSSSENNYDIIVLSDEITLVSRKKMKALVKSDNISIRFLEVSCALENRNFSFRCEQLSRSTFARLLLPEMLPHHEKIVYLDCDLILQNDVAILYSEDVSDCLLGAIKDRFVSVLRNSQEEEYNHIKKHVALEDGDDYFNAGVLVMNLKEFRKRYTCDYMMEIATSRKWMWEDQDVLNHLCRKSVKWISPKWNMFWGTLEPLRDIMMQDMEFYEAFNNPCIIHYAGGSLPIKAFDSTYSVEFWETARKTPFYESVLMMATKNQTKEVIKEWKLLLNAENEYNFGLVARRIDEKARYLDSRVTNLEKEMNGFFKKKIKRVLKKIIFKFFGPVIGDISDEQREFEYKSMELLEKLEEINKEKRDDL